MIVSHRLHVRGGNSLPHEGEGESKESDDDDGDLNRHFGERTVNGDSTQRLSTDDGVNRRPA
jgi:hypothetical protein